MPRTPLGANTKMNPSATAVTATSPYSAFILSKLLPVAWLTDIGGYIFGKLFRGPKLTKISPNKTWSGAFGSLILSQFAFLIFFLDVNYKLNFNIFFFQLLLSIVGQIGDILMSYIKRINKIKDTSNFIPGHGGFLDRLDGLIWIFIFGNFII